MGSCQNKQDLTTDAQRQKENPKSCVTPIKDDKSKVVATPQYHSITAGQSMIPQEPKKIQQIKFPQKISPQKPQKKSRLNDYQAMLDERGFKEFNNVCDSGNKIERYCYNDKCDKSASLCGNMLCSTCRELHPDCAAITFKQLDSYIQEKFYSRKKFFVEMFNIEDMLFNKLIENRKELIQTSKACEFQGPSRSAFQFIYLNNITHEVKGREVKVLFDQLSKKNRWYKTGLYLNTYKRQGQQIVSQLQKVQRNIIEMSTANIQSMIFANDPQGSQKYSYLLKQLNNPFQLKLLFRASQHNFSASKFHQHCDGISDTLTIIRTEFGKTIAAYSPFEWKTVPSQKFTTDESLQSFLLQLELKQKMSLTTPKAAILNYPNWGPSFGAGDLCIGDECNRNQSSGSYFPTSYNCNGKYQNNQESYTAFCGSTNGYTFRVVEYEVFAVLQ